MNTLWSQKPHKYKGRYGGSLGYEVETGDALLCRQTLGLTKKFFHEKCEDQ